MSKMSNAKEVNVPSLFAELNRCGQNGDYERALKTSNKIVQLCPLDHKALHCKIVCLIQLSKFKDALNLINNPQYFEVLSNLYFEKAYIQYRLNFPSDALQTVDSAPELTSALKELRAQILYRLEKYSECFTLYRDVVKNTNDDYEDERQTNMAAAYAYIAEKESSVGPWSSDDLNRYEMQYNAACAEAINGKPTEAVILLHRADAAAAQGITEDGGGQEEILEETAIIKVQLAYCLQLQGKDKEAAALYQSVLKNKPSDPALVAIASNNLVVINKETNVFDSRKRMKAATQDGLEHKLTLRQRRSILYNQALLSVYSSQDELCKQLCTRLVKDFNMQKEATLIEATLLSRAKQPQAVDVLLKHPDLKLAAVHLLLLQSDYKAAIKILESNELRFKAGVISALVLLYLAENNRDAVTKLFEEALHHLKGNKEGIDVEEAWRSRHGGKGGPTSGRALARLLVADPHGGLHLAQKLPAIKNTGGIIDVDALESSNWMMGAKVVKKSTLNKSDQSPGTPGTDMSKKKTKHRKRKTKLPSNVDLSVPPDPERWLPRYERAVFRKRRQRGPRQEVMKGSQGMTTSATDQYDMTKQQTVPGKSPRVVEKQSTPSEPGWQKNKQQQKKKRKGGKW